MAREHAHCGPALDVPHAHAAVWGAGGGEDVGAVGVPGDGVNGGVVAYEEPVGRGVRCAPEARGAVCAAGDEVVSVWTEADVPDWA